MGITIFNCLDYKQILCIIGKSMDLKKSMALSLFSNSLMEYIAHTPPYELIQDVAHNLEMTNGYS